MTQVPAELFNFFGASVLSVSRRRPAQLFPVSGVTPVTPLAIASITVLSSTSMRVFFNQTVTDNPALRFLLLYRSTPALALLGLAVDAGSPDPISVVLTTSEMLQGGAYTLFIDRLDSVADADSTLSHAFTGVGVAPRVASAAAIIRTRVRVHFNEPMSGVALTTPANYTITPAGGSAARSVISVIATPGDPDSVDLQLDGDLTTGVANYTVAVANAADVAGNPVDPAHNSAVFDGAIAHATTEVDHAKAAIDRLIWQYRDKPGIENTLLALAAEAQALEQSGADVLAYRGLETAIGATLDEVGGLLGLPRHGLPDATYRVRLRARVAMIASRGHPEDMISILRILDNGFAPGQLSLIEMFPAAYVLHCKVPLGAEMTGELFAAELHRAQPAGVQAQLQFEEQGATLFSWDLSVTDGDSAPPATSGFAEDATPTVGGIWAEAI